MSIKKYLPQITIILITICIFYNVFSSSYVIWDDNVFIAENSTYNLSFIEATKSYFSNFFFGDYIPLTLLSYWIEIKFFGMSSLVQHLNNLLLHLVNIILVWKILDHFLVREVERGKIFTVFFSCLIFAIHPLQVESVMWISERKGLLSLFFTLLAILGFQKCTNGRNKLSLASYYLFFVMAILCKASNIFIPLWLLIYNFTAGDKKRNSYTKHLLPISIMILFFYIRYQAYADNLPDLNKSTFDINRLVQIPISILNVLGFISKSFFTHLI